MCTGISDPAKKYLFPDDPGTPGPIGEKLRQFFMLNRPSGYTFLKRGGRHSLKGSEFAAIPEWDVFIGHSCGCERCHE